VLRVIVTLLGCLAYILSIGQFSKVHEQQIVPLSELSAQAMPVIDNQTLLLQEENKRKSSNATPKFAYPISVNYDTQKNGTWQSIEDQSIWRLVIESKGAHSLNLGFSKFYLPASASLYIYDYYGAERLRPFLPSDNEEHEQLWAPLISSDKIVIEINIKSADIKHLKLVLNYINHDFMDVQKSISGACHIDVKCGESTGYSGVEDFRDQIRSVGLYTLQGVSICSGFLINNTNQDCRPYFMTANHCNLNASNAASMVTYWNYENSNCREPGSYSSAETGDGDLSQFNTGAILRSTWGPSDFTLVEMDDAIPEEVNPYFCGWDISSNLPSRGVVIHHPNLEEKRISFKYSSLYLGEWGQETTPVADGKHLIVDAWDLGSTEDGSSGAPLFNRQGLVVGQLHGGLASCGNDEYDAFGRLFSSWTGGGVPENRLIDWLDPGNLGTLSLSGRNCVFNIELSDNNFTKCSTDGFFEVAVSVGDSFQGPIELTFEALPMGAFALFEQTTVNSGQTTNLIVSNLNELAAGSYNFDIVAKGQIQTTRIPLHFNILSAVSEPPTLVYPEQRSTIDISETLLKWDEDPTTNIYKLQIARDENFTDLLVDQVLSGSAYDASEIFTPNQAYFYRVKSVNLCGESEWSIVYQFLTINLFCIEDQSLEAQEILQDTPNIIYAPISNDIEGTVVTVKVNNIRGEHSFVSDLRFSLISPEGTEVQLVGDKCSFTKDFNLGFSDDGAAKIICPLTNQIIYKPIQALSTFKGESALGEWNLKIEDRNKFDGGMLQSWSIEICINSSNDFSLTGEFATLNMCTNETYNLPLFLGAGFDTDTNLIFESNKPSITEITPMEGGVNVTINPSGNSSPGNYPILISVRDIFGNRAIFKLDVIIIDDPVAFELISPIDQTIVENQNFELDWSISTFAKEYIITIGLDKNFDSVVFADTVSQTNYELPKIFAEGQIYYWVITAKNRCGFEISETKSFSIEQTNSIQSSFTKGLNIFPNPTKDFIQIQDLNNEAREFNLLIQTIDGKIMYENSVQFRDGSYSIPVSNWPSGIYIVSANYQTYVQISRIVVQ